jgi:phenylacetic acid degradation operon negative regulatory protein
VSQPSPFSARPQELLLTVLGAHVLPSGLLVPMSAFVSALGDLGVSEHAARATVQRAVARDLLRREQRGRRAYFALSDRAHALLTEGTSRILDSDPVRDAWDGTWTLLSFSLPEGRRDDRHRLRVRLSWAGFGPLRDGLWIAPGDVAMEGIIEDLAIDGHVEAFVATTKPTTDPARFIDRVWDLASLRTRYDAFVARWQRPGRAISDLVAEVLLLTEWRLLIRDDPRLPRRYLPADWPATTAAHLLRRRYDELHDRADEAFRAALAAAPRLSP